MTPVTGPIVPPLTASSPVGEMPAASAATLAGAHIGAVSKTTSRISTHVAELLASAYVRVRTESVSGVAAGGQPEADACHFPTAFN